MAIVAGVGILSSLTVLFSYQKNKILRENTDRACNLNSTGKDIQEQRARCLHMLSQRSIDKLVSEMENKQQADELLFGWLKKENELNSEIEALRSKLSISSEANQIKVELDEKMSELKFAQAQISKILALN